jgi:hypothetical protein
MEQPLAMLVAAHVRHVVRSAVLAIGAIRPTGAFQPLASLVVIVELGGGEIDGALSAEEILELCRSRGFRVIQDSLG